MMGLLLTEKTSAFVSQPTSPMTTKGSSSSRSRFSTTTGCSMVMGMDMPPPIPSPPTTTVTSNTLPAIQTNQYAGPADVRYSDFLKLVNSDRIEKVTFTADGLQLLGVDVTGSRFKIDALPNDAELLTQLTTHKVSCSLFEEKINCNFAHMWL